MRRTGLGVKSPPACSSTRATCRRLAAVCSLALLPNCKESTNPDELTCPAAEVSLCTASAETSAAAVSAIRDVDLRIAGALSNRDVADSLAELSAKLVDAMNDGRVSHARAMLEAMRQAIAAARSTASGVGDEPDLSAVELALRPTDQLLH